MLTPRQKTPNLTLPLLSGGTFDLATDGNARGTLVVFYRGLHCPLCIKYLKELDTLVPTFADRGVGVVAVSSDDADRTAQMADRVGAGSLRFAHSLPLATARDWGLFISTGRGKTSIGIEEPALFSEPGLFLISPDRSLYFSSVQTMPFIRPSFEELVGALDFVIEKNYPARGEYTGDLPSAA